jgi:chloramphenicol-sensitive protein RarD
MKRGIVLALSAYIFWGFFPVYFKQLQNVEALEIAANRIIWTFAFLFVINLLGKNWKQLIDNVIKGKNKFYMFFPALLIGTNWFVYVWAINAGFIIETSLGYFISPLFSVFFGVFFLKESLRKVQWFAVSIAAIGVLYMTIVYGNFPWIALYLAVTWSLYGLLRKKSPLSSIEGLTVESGLLSIPVFVYLLIHMINGTGSLFAIDLRTDLFLLGCGLVTALPLLVFVKAARLIDLSLIGILQYIYPTLLLLVGVFIYDEILTEAKIVGFVFIWTALFIYTTEGTIFLRKKRMRLGTQTTS